MSSSSYTPPVGHILHAGYAHPTLRAWQSAPALAASSLVYPLFIVAGDNDRQEIPSMPGQSRWGVSRLPEALDAAVQDGLDAVLLFGVNDVRGACAGGGEARVQACYKRASRML